MDSVGEETKEQKIVLYPKQQTARRVRPLAKQGQKKSLWLSGFVAIGIMFNWFIFNYYSGFYCYLLAMDMFQSYSNRSIRLELVQLNPIGNDGNYNNSYIP